MKIVAKHQCGGWSAHFGRAAAGIALVVGCAALQAAAPSLRDVLTTEEFDRAGLSKLTAAELEFLSQRLLGGGSDHPVPAAQTETRRLPATVAADPRADRVPAVDPEDSFGREKQIEAEREQQQEANREIKSRIAGKFTGWSGRTVFRLENGQVWQQVEPAVFSVDLEGPVVTVRRSRLGAFHLGVEGYGSQVKVKRIR